MHDLTEHHVFELYIRGENMSTWEEWSKNLLPAPLLEKITAFLKPYQIFYSPLGGGVGGGEFI
jgi:hypothetical protein